MRLTTTLALFLVSVVLGVVLGVSERSPTGPAGGESEGGTLLLRLDPDKVEKIEIVQGTAKTGLLKRQGFWFITEPEADRADPEAMRSLLDILAHLSVRDVLEEGETTGGGGLSPAALGLEGDAAIAVTLHSRDSHGAVESQTVVLGQAAALDNTIYACREGDVPREAKQPHVVVGNPRRYLEKAAETLRDPHLLLIPAEAITQVGLRLPGGEVEAMRQILPQPTAWRLSRPIASRADLDLMDRLVSGVTSLRVEKVLAPRGLELPAPGEPMPEGTLVVELRLHGIEQPLTLTLRPAPEAPGDATPPAGAAPALAATVSDRPATYLVRTELPAFVPSDPKGFRDSRLTRLPAALIRQIEIKSREDPDVVLEAKTGREGFLWYSHRNGEQELADQNEVNAFIDAVNREKILDFVSDSPAQVGTYGLNPPALTVTFGIAQPVPGDPQAPPKIVPYTLLLGSTNESTLFANFSGEPFIYSLSPAFRSRIPTHPLKWRNLKVLSFSRINLLQIRREIPGQPESVLELDYQYETDSWSGSQAGQPLGERLDDIIAGRVSELLGSLTATDWLIALSSAYQALSQPSAQVSVKVKQFDRATRTSQTVERRFKFAPAAGGYYYGIEEGYPDVFLVNGETYRELMTPIFRTRD